MSVLLDTISKFIVRPNIQRRPAEAQFGCTFQVREGNVVSPDGKVFGSLFVKLKCFSFFGRSRTV